jgi:hypothetical protein
MKTEKKSRPIQDELPEFKLSGNDGFKAPSESIAQTLGVSSRALESFVVDTYTRNTPTTSSDLENLISTLESNVNTPLDTASPTTSSDLESRISALESLIGQINTLVGLPELPVISGEDLRKEANKQGKDDGIRFERLADGTFQEYIDGSKGKVFTEEELRAELPESSTTPIYLSGEDLRKEANELGKDDDIRYERLADGTYQQYIDGSKGEVFTEEELREHTEDREAEKAKDAEKENVSDSGLPVASHRSGEIRIPGITPFNVYTEISQHNSNSLSLQVNVSNLAITGSSFVSEYAPGALEDMVVFSGDDQTQFTIPLARKSGGTWIVESEGGVYILPVLCVNGKPAIFPVRVC